MARSIAAQDSPSSKAARISRSRGSGGGGDQPAHPPHLRRQPAHAVPDETAEALRERDGLIGKGCVRMVEERTGALQGVEGVSAAGVIQPGQGVPGQHGPQP